MKLNEVLQDSGAEVASGNPGQVTVTGISHDSRKVQKGELFVAIPGGKQDGTRFVADAVKQGASAVLAERSVAAEVPVLVVPNARRALATVAANYYGKPASELVLLGVTGTNGKTTVAHLLEAITAVGRCQVGLLGTIHHRFAGKEVPATHTTPDPVELHRMLKEMVDEGIDTVVMEVSSHALAQERVHGLTFRAAAFTNLSRDHLDYHGELEDYFQAKRRLFSENLSAGGVAVVNGDDTHALRIYSELRGQKRMAWKFSRTGAGELSAEGVEYGPFGIRATLKTPAGDIVVKSPLIGPHNLENILAAAGVALGAGFSRIDVQDGISRVRSVPGRMEAFEGKGLTVVVDYAHTDEALRRSLEATRGLTRGRLITVFGCGGERDAGKRPLMGQAAAEGADLQIVTNDNPRGEDPDEIVAQIAAGLEKGGAKRMSAGKAKAGEGGYLVELDRRAAIELALQLAKPGDAILVAGKGHEASQEISGERKPFDDREEVRRLLSA